MIYPLKDHVRWKHANTGLLEAIMTIIALVIGLFLAYKVYEALGASALFIIILVLEILLAILLLLLKG